MQAIQRYARCKLYRGMLDASYTIQRGMLDASYTMKNLPYFIFIANLVV